MLHNIGHNVSVWNTESERGRGRETQSRFQIERIGKPIISVRVNVYERGQVSCIKPYQSNVVTHECDVASGSNIIRKPEYRTVQITREGRINRVTMLLCLRRIEIETFCPYCILILGLDRKRKETLNLLRSFIYLLLLMNI